MKSVSWISQLQFMKPFKPLNGGRISSGHTILSTRLDNPVGTLLCNTVLVDWFWGCYLPQSTPIDVMGQKTFCVLGCMSSIEREFALVHMDVNLVDANAVLSRAVIRLQGQHQQVTSALETSLSIQTWRGVTR